MELAGPLPAVNGYDPCVFHVPVTGVYNVAMFGPLGDTSSVDGESVGEIALTNASHFNSEQKASIAAWDITVRSNISSVVNLDGRVFTYALAMYGGALSRPLFITVYAVTLDGFIYSVETVGLDSQGVLIFGSQDGFLNSDQTPLFRDVRGTNSLFQSLVMSVGFAQPDYPIFLTPPDLDVLINLSIPILPQIPITSFAILDTASKKQPIALVGQNFSFQTTSSLPTSATVLVSRYLGNFDPSNESNAVFHLKVPTGTFTHPTVRIVDNLGAAFPKGRFQVRFIQRSGEIHFPLLDVEANLGGGPKITLLNAPCPDLNGGCNGGFYDDRGYRLKNAAVVGTANGNLCGGAIAANPPRNISSNSEFGFDTSTSQRAFGVNTDINDTNAECLATNAFGDAKGLDLWTYTRNVTQIALWMISTGITGRVFYDRNGDGLFTSGSDYGFYNATVKFTDPAHGNTATYYTDQQGYFAAELVYQVPASSTYGMVVTVPPGLTCTTANQAQNNFVINMNTVLSSNPVGLRSLTQEPTNAPTTLPTAQPTRVPSVQPTNFPSTEPTTPQPTISPTRAPSNRPSSSPTTSTSGALVPPNKVLVPYSPVNSTVASGPGNITVVVSPDPGFKSPGNISLEALPPNGTLSTIARVTFVGPNGEMPVSDLSELVRIRIPIVLKALFGTVCFEGVPVTKVLPECKYLDTKLGQWVSSGCTRTNVSDTEIECSCSHFTDFAAILPLYHNVPAEAVLALTAENMGKHPVGIITVMLVILLFLIIFAVAVYRDRLEAQGADLRDAKQAKWGKRHAGKMVGQHQSLWKEIKTSFQLRHTWMGLINRKSGTSFRSADRAIVALVSVFAGMCMSARFHNIQQTWLGRGEVIVFSVLVCLLPAQVLMQLFVRTGPMGFYEEWQLAVGLQRPSKYNCLNKRFTANWRFVWIALALLATIAMIVYVLTISLYFDQNPKYYCLGDTAMSWVTDWISSYAVAVLLVEPLKICVLVAISRFQERAPLFTSTTSASTADVDLKSTNTSASLSQID